jgi:hypothetical protein
VDCTCCRKHCRRVDFMNLHKKIQTIFLPYIDSCTMFQPKLRTKKWLRLCTIMGKVVRNSTYVDAILKHEATSICGFWNLRTKKYLRIKISAEIFVRICIDRRGISAVPLPGAPFYVGNFYFSARKNHPQIRKWTYWPWLILVPK